MGCSLGVLVIAGVVFGAIFFHNYTDYDHDPITENPEDLGVVAPPDGKSHITNIALFGIDSREENYRGLSDTIMIISIDTDTGSIKLVSVMRDSLVKVEGHGYQKINAAYSIGGPELAIKTLNQTFRLNILEYATVDFVGMAEIVDAVGGVEVELTKYEISQVNDCITELAQRRGLPKDYVSKAGVQTLSGVQAVGFSRVRKVPTVNGTRDDYGRTERQRLVMNQLFQKALQMPLTQYPTLIKAMLPYIRTSMGYDDIFSLAKILKSDQVTMEQGRIPIDDSVISSGFNVPYIGSCVYYDLEYAADLLNAFLFDDITFEDYVAANGIRKNAWYGSTGSSGGSSSQKPKPTDTSTNSTETTDTSAATDTETVTDSGTVTDTEPSVSTSLPILPSTTDTSENTDSSSGTGSSSAPATDGGTSSDTQDSGTETDTESSETETDSSDD